MAKRPTNDASGDNDELQALFDSITSESTKPAQPAAAAASASGDSDDLQALFDSVAAGQGETSNVIEGQAREVSADTPQTPEEKRDSVFHQIGQMTRLLHDTLRELGYDRVLEETARQIPDARQRLNYIANMTEQAASRVLNATDVAKPIQEQLQTDAEALNERWNKLYAKELSVDEFKALAGETHAFIGKAANDAKVVDAQLLEIMMAQDFQDLTGQVIKKIVEMAASLEDGLLNVLIEVMPDDKRSTASEGLLNGPVVSAQGREDVVANQEQVDDLLESLGF